jgi:hypothetical protein
MRTLSSQLNSIVDNDSKHLVWRMVRFPTIERYSNAFALSRILNAFLALYRFPNLELNVASTLLVNVFTITA